MGQYEDAITEYKMAIWLDSLNIPAYRHLCKAYEDMGDYDNAIESYKKLIQILPNMPEFHANLANILYVKGDIDEAISHFQTAVTLNPSKQWTSVINQTLGFVFKESKDNIDAAISSYQSAYLMTPEDIDIYVNLGSAFYDKEDYENSLTIYRNALDLDPKNAKIHCNLGFLYWGKGDLDEALKEYQLAIDFDPNYDIAYNNMKPEMENLKTKTKYFTYTSDFSQGNLYWLVAPGRVHWWGHVRHYIYDALPYFFHEGQ
jgi:tetratricopeptide (TPR) repeat protein